MSGNPLHASFYADACRPIRVRLLDQRRLAKDTYLARFVGAEADGEQASCGLDSAEFVPGQFAMLRLADTYDPLIGRPLAIYDIGRDTAGRPCRLDFGYVAKGKFTSRLARAEPGQRLDLWGPLGNGFGTAACETLLMVAGGIGFTPFLALAQEALGTTRFGTPLRESGYAQRVVFCLGARSAEYLIPPEPWEELGVEVRIATDDGSRGQAGLVTRLVQDELGRQTGSGAPRSLRIACCGPEPMMAAVSQIAERANVPCEVSLETPMACGIGICFTCVAPVRDDAGGWDYQRTCVEGPVFEARRIVW